MAHACRATILLVIIALTATSIDRVQSKIKKVEFLVDKATNRRIGYVVTKVHPIDRKDDLSDDAKESNKTAVAKEEKKIDRNTLNDDDQELTNETFEPSLDAQAVETSFSSQLPDGELSAASLATDAHFEHVPPPEEHVKTITIVKKVPDPYIVEKTVFIPRIKKIPYAIEVPVAEPFLVEKPIFHPVKVIHRIPTYIPKPIAVIQESYYPVHKPVDRWVPHKIFVPHPIPIEKKVYHEMKVPDPQPFKLERKIPFAVKIAEKYVQPVPQDKIVPYVQKIEKENPIAVPVIKPYGVPITKHVPYFVDKIVPVPVKVKVDNPIPVFYDKPAPYPVFEEEEKKEEKVTIESKSEKPSEREPAKVYEDTKE